MENMHKTKLLPRKRRIAHRIGKHGAVGILVRKGNKVTRVCTECGEEIKNEL